MTFVNFIVKIKYLYADNPLQNFVVDPSLTEDDMKDIIMIRRFSFLFDGGLVLFYIYYYYAIWSYIYTTEENQKELNARRNLEENLLNKN